MITIVQTINRADKTISWHLTVTEPEHDFDGRKCHAIDSGVLTARDRGMFMDLGFRQVGCQLRPEIDTHLEYWAPVED